MSSNTISYETFIETRSSKGIVEDYRPAPQQNLVEPPSDYRILWDMVRNDPVLWTAIDLTVDMVTYNGYEFIGDESQALEAKKYFEDELDFDQVLKNNLTQLLTYGDSFIEVEGNPAVKIHPLPTSEMAIKYDEHGSIIQYIQRPYNSTVKTQQTVIFDAESIMYMRLYWVGNRVYSYSPFEATIKAFNSKIFANHYLQQLFKNLHPKVIYFLKNASKDAYLEFIENVRRVKGQPGHDLVVKSEGDAKLLQYAFDGGLLQVLEYLRTEVLMVTRVPKIWIGLTDSSNRSTAEAVLIPYETRVKKIQQIVSSYINREFMKKTPYPNLVFRFNPISLMDEKAILDNAQVLSTLGLQSEDPEKDPVILYLRSKGISIPKGVMRNFNSPTPDNQFPSRKGVSPQDKMNTNLNRKGVSDAGGEKLKETQQATRA